jgi:hypothetical protein
MPQKKKQPAARKPAASGGKAAAKKREPKKKPKTPSVERARGGDYRVRNNSANTPTYYQPNTPNGYRSTSSGNYEQVPYTNTANPNETPSWKQDTLIVR